MTNRILRPHGGYRTLLSYRMATVVYDLTVEFCDMYPDRTNRSYKTRRLYSQMVSAARSGKQNIVEASQDSATSKKTEMKLLGIARGSLEELLEDYADFLRQRDLRLWDKSSDEVRTIREAYRTNKTNRDRTYRSYLERGPEPAANLLITLIHQTNFLLDRQIESVEKQFLERGGFTERLYRKRREYRSDRTDKTDKNRTDRTNRTDR